MYPQATEHCMAGGMLPASSGLSGSQLVHVALTLRTNGQGLGTFLLSETGSTDRKLPSLFSPSLRAEYNTTTPNTTISVFFIHRLPALPAQNWKPSFWTGWVSHIQLTDCIVSVN